MNEKTQFKNSVDKWKALKEQMDFYALAKQYGFKGLYPIELVEKIQEKKGLIV